MGGTPDLSAEPTETRPCGALRLLQHTRRPLTGAGSRLGSRGVHGGTAGRAVGWEGVSPLGAQGPSFPPQLCRRCCCGVTHRCALGPCSLAVLCPGCSPCAVPRLLCPARVRPARAWPGRTVCPSKRPRPGHSLSVRPPVCLSVHPALLWAVLPALRSRPCGGVSSRPAVLPQEGRISALARCFLAPPDRMRRHILTPADAHRPRSCA